ncbi:MAG: hypothetical protein JJ931_07765 [Henriciella sp.]|nr:hypothetical protein [Henriciella sp.]MBO6695298.1 hypothetical protein [Henriciella sp.]
MSRIFPLALIVAGLVAPASADPVIEMMRSLSKDGPIYAYEMIYSDAEVSAVGKIDPSQPEGQRILVTSPAESEWSDDFREGLEEMESETDGDIWCTDFAEMVPSEISALEENDTTITYAFTPQPESDADGMEKKMMKKLKAMVTLDKTDGSVLAFNMKLPKPYKPAMVAKINMFEMDATCARAPDGRTFVETFDFKIAGSAMMQSFDETVSRKITRLLDPVG